jgi:hypothetical protein
MTTSQSTSLAFDFAVTFAEAIDLQTRSAPGALRRTYGWADGAGANQANRVWASRRTLGASANESLDLAATLLDAFGVAITFARVRALIIAPNAANTNNVAVGGAAANGFLGWVGTATDTIVVRPGGLLVLVAPDAVGYVVTPATGDLLKVANSGAGTSVTYEVAIVGAAT